MSGVRADGARDEALGLARLLVLVLVAQAKVAVRAGGRGRATGSLLRNTA
jgi:hypothetical protein